MAALGDNAPVELIGKMPKGDSSLTEVPKRDLGLLVGDVKLLVAGGPGQTVYLGQDGGSSNQVVRESWMAVATLRWFPKFGQNFMKSKLKTTSPELLLALTSYFED